MKKRLLSALCLIALLATCCAQEAPLPIPAAPIA